MDKIIEVKPIGKVVNSNSGFAIQIAKEYLPALTSIAGFSHIQVVWWGHLYDSPEYRANLVAGKPYKKGPDMVGVFATRSPVRPNPILLTTIDVQRIDLEQGIIHTSYIDAEVGTPILDIKPYHLSERVRNVSVPGWCRHWPEWLEDSAMFDWQGEFNF
jgi:tRNA (Thr-GGU) A37 N-methylase